MIKEGKELNDVVCTAYRMGCDQTREVYQKRVEELEASESEWQPICDSYAAENQRLSDRIEKLEAALREIVDAPDSMLVHCGLCRHEWFALKLPMLMLDAAVLMENMVCPECDEWSHNIYCGLAPVDKLNTSAERVNETGES